jgi:D-alanine-D-alanine ligase
MDLKEKIIAVVMGGTSGEREVSLESGEAVAKALTKKGYNVKKLVVNHQVADQLKKEKIDVAFIALHGGWGEDGRAQALCEMLNIPYTGSGVLASALAMNKPQAKAIFVHHNIPTPAYCPALSRIFVMKKMGLKPPIVIKPSSEGSTLGVSIVTREEEFDAALEKACQYDQHPMVEEYIEGREITVGVLDGQPLGVVEIIPRQGFYDFHAKYTSGGSEYQAPASIPGKATEEIRRLAKAAYEALGCAGGARVDLRLSERRGPFVLEVNTIPGMTSHSLLPKSAAVMGIEFEELVERMLQSSKKHMWWQNEKKSDKQNQPEEK